ncbi:arsinothricin resistance N-acetyltransferase ArsN1 family B [Halalkalicoccus jeotgali]|uniref:Phosphinothricin N-acetyltransferase n=1 Tax=Halalkalicoccus jeotgali (strain DSM 18796 / CECT 7217 / JCM 14584 / KCTC 4019 / B3) TaxID=795797 RepID=D8J990_HALJB|nr:arsinothricin resistance N-acetyltransferase ArsN1 family B [Halalkalicoccus jeotgali]ADJ16359.1 phosphinothricin N-acetyltransferase [Halalkalicoccus jeotgali B3]ELY37093.1 phosphinothricin N-acetyltransferase [Halalkalicoccus jeotgali B3]
MTPTLRPATADDAPAIRRIYAPFVEESAVSFETRPPTATEVGTRIATTTERHPWLVCTDGDVIGYAYATSHREREAYRWSIDVSVYVDPAYHRRGIARALYGALFALAGEQGFLNAYAGISLPNPASTAFHESMGFEPVGTYHDVGHKDGEWHDVRWYERALAERPTDPDPPTPYPALDAATVERAVGTGASLLEG